MAVTVKVEDVAVAIRAVTDPEAVPKPIATTLGFLFPAACTLVVAYAPDAPEALHNAAAIRLTGWLYDADPTDNRIRQAIEVSGAASLLSRYRAHRAGAITGTDQTPGGGGAVPAGAGLPPLPGEGNYILTVQNGELVWVEFPLPS